MEFPQKRYYRQRAHSNPLSDHSFDYPVTPDEMDWSSVFPQYTGDVAGGVDFLDIGCGYGGLIVNLSPLFPDKLMLGFEIRVKVSDYVQDRICALQETEDGYSNIACIRTNAMKYLPNYFHKAQLSKMFFMFPDPHFKRSKHKWRIINSQLLAEYAYVLKKGGLVYTITDVEDLHVWMVHHLSAHPLFTRVPDDQLTDDVIIQHLYNSSEEGQKVTRNSGSKWLAVFTRV